MIERARLLSDWSLCAVLVVAGVLAAVGVHWVGTLIALAAVACVALVRPSLVVASVILSVPIQSAIVLPFVRGEITVTQLMLFGLIPGWLFVFWTRRIWLDSIVVGFMFVVAAYVFSFVVVNSPSLWFQETYRWAVAGVFYVICRSVITAWQDVRLCMWAISAGVVGVSFAALSQLVTDGTPDKFLVGGAVRVYATFGTPNTLAAYLEMTVPILLACFAAYKWGAVANRFSNTESWMFLLAAGLGLSVVGLTQSRGGWIGMAVGCAVLWMNVPGRTKFVVLGASVVLVGAFLLTPPGQSQFDRFLELRDEGAVESNGIIENQSSYDTGSGRGALWATARVMIAENPIVGVGAGEFDEHYREYVPSWIDRFPRGQAHNVWLQMGAQAGFIGIAAYSVWYAASLWNTITARRRCTSAFHRWIITGVLAVLAAYTVHSLVDYLNVLSMGLQLSAITAIALNLAPEPLTRYLPAAQQKPTICYPEYAACPK